MATLEDILALMGDDEFEGLVDLIQLGDEAVPHLSRILTDSSCDIFLRQQAAVALGRIGAMEGAGAIEAAIEDEMPVLRLTAARALALIKGEEATDSLEKLLKNDDLSVQKVAVQSLAEVGSDDAVRALKEFQKLVLSDFLQKEIDMALEKLHERGCR